jgi:hypothetical protein
MAILRIEALAAADEGSDAYTFTLGQVCCVGVVKATDMMGIPNPPETNIVMIKLTESTVMVTVDQ